MRGPLEPLSASDVKLADSTNGPRGVSARSPMASVQTAGDCLGNARLIQWFLSSWNTLGISVFVQLFGHRLFSPLTVGVKCRVIPSSR